MNASELQEVIEREKWQRFAAKSSSADKMRETIANYERKHGKASERKPAADKEARPTPGPQERLALEVLRSGKLSRDSQRGTANQPTHRDGYLGVVYV